MALEPAEISVGELVAHLVPVSRLDDIARHLSILLGQDFLKELTRTVPEGFDRPLGEILPHFYESFSNLFEMRHIFAHEMAIGVRPSAGEAFRHLGVVTFAAFT